MQTSPTPRASLLSLTGIRFIAAFIVVLFHINIALNTYDPLHDRSFDVLTHGYIGVSLFFVLSGFILTYTYIQPDRTLRGDRMTFWRARFARVYPVYVFALFVSGPLFAKRFLGAPLALESPQNVLGALFTPLLLQAWWPTTACQWNCAGWSLSVEALFYAVFPLLGVWLAKRSARTALIVAAVMWLGCLLFPVLYLAVSPDGTQAVTESSKTFWLMGLKYNPVVHLGEFAVGITCGLLFLRRSALEGNDTVPSWRMWGVLAIIIALVAGPWVPYPLLHSGVLAPLFAL